MSIDDQSAAVGPELEWLASGDDVDTVMQNAGPATPVEKRRPSVEDLGSVSGRVTGKRVDGITAQIRDIIDELTSEILEEVEADGPLPETSKFEMFEHVADDVTVAVAAEHLAAFEQTDNATINKDDIRVRMVKELRDTAKQRQVA